MKKINNSIAKCSVVLLLFAVFSCQDLTENPISSLSPINYFDTPEQCESVYANSLVVVYSQWGLYGGGLDATLISDQKEGGNFNYSNQVGYDYWRVHTSALNSINGVLNAINNFDKLGNYSIEVKNDIIAQGRFLRAFNHFYLVRLFGKVPYFNENVNYVTTPLVPEDRLEITAVYDKIEADLLYASQNLGNYDASKPSKINKWTAKALLAKVYLTRATAPVKDASYYVKSRDMADDVIKNGPFVFQATFADVISKANRKNKEIIFGLNASAANKSTTAKYQVPVELAGDGVSTVSVDWTNLYPDQPRKKAYIMLQWPKSKGNLATMIPYTASKSQRPYVGKMTWPYYSYDEFKVQAGVDSDRAVLRLADVYLIYAEAQNMADGSPNATAVNLVNKIIKRANETTGTEELATIGMTKEDFDTKVINERNFELCFEGDRYYDLVRKHLFEAVLLQPGQLNGFAEYKYLFPIPGNEGIGQNPGY